jgi:hypothetical protein
MQIFASPARLKQRQNIKVFEVVRLKMERMDMNMWGL